MTEERKTEIVYNILELMNACECTKLDIDLTDLNRVIHISVEDKCEDG